MTLTPAQILAHNLTNQLQAASGYVDLEQPAKVKVAISNAADLAHSLQQLLRVREDIPA